MAYFIAVHQIQNVPKYNPKAKTINIFDSPQNEVKNPGHNASNKLSWKFKIYLYILPNESPIKRHNVFDRRPFIGSETKSNMVTVFEK